MGFYVFYFASFPDAFFDSACVRACCRAVSTNCSSAVVIGVIYLDGTLCFRITSVIHMTKIGTIQRRLAWPLRKDDTHNSWSVPYFCSKNFEISIFAISADRPTTWDRTRSVTWPGHKFMGLHADNLLDFSWNRFSSLWVFLCCWMVAFAAERHILPIWVFTGVVTSFLHDGVLQ